MVRNLITIGGGELGRTKVMPDSTIKTYPVETLQIDKKALELTGKANPKLLVIGTANNNNEGYYNVVKYHFEKRLNCQVSLLDENKNLEQQLLNADVIYISGGDTRYMLYRWQELGLDKKILEAYNNGLVVMGYSAGAICWFDYYDNFDYETENNFKPALLPGLGLLKGTMVPHYDNVAEEKRKIINKLAQENNSILYKVNNAEAIFWQNEKPLF